MKRIVTLTLVALLAAACVNTPESLLLRLRFRKQPRPRPWLR